ncbi:MAG: hypothetical protein PHP65_03355 [Bacilli bacterium]|nr:hypothetical protein [Bacilli bacterium]
MKRILLMLLLIFISLSGCSSSSVEDDYPMLKEMEHVYVKSNYAEVTEALTVKEGVNIILFSYNPHLYECPFCLAVMTLINEAALKVGVTKILYLDIYEMRKNNTTEYQLLLGYLDSKVGDLIEREGVKKIIVPDLYVVKDGEIVTHHIATLKDGDGAFIYDLTENQKQELIDLYELMFQLAY